MILLYSSWKELLFGVPQLLIKDVDFASYADDNTPYVIGDNIDQVISALENAAASLFNWFSDNQMKANPNKCHLLINKDCKKHINIDGNIIGNSNCEKLLGIKVDSKLDFKHHVEDLCSKASRKMHALARISPYMDIPKKRMLFNAFFKSQFSYCPLTWMCHSRRLNNKINILHERCLRIIYTDKQSSFEELLKKDKSVSIHHQNIRSLAIEMYKVSKGLAPDIFTNIFKIRDNVSYDLRHLSDFEVPRVSSLYNGTETMSYLGPKVWDILPNEIKEKATLEAFKAAIKEWKPENCPCRLCKRFIAGVGFI